MNLMILKLEGMCACYRNVQLNWVIYMAMGVCHSQESWQRNFKPVLCIIRHELFTSFKTSDLGRAWNDGTVLLKKNSGEKIQAYFFTSIKSRSC